MSDDKIKHKWTIYSFIHIFIYLFIYLFCLILIYFILFISLCLFIINDMNNSFNRNEDVAIVT